MTEPAFKAGRPVVVGANHRSSSVMMRERLFIEKATLPDFLGSLKAEGIEQAVALSTGDRVEVQAIHSNTAEAAARICKVLAQNASLKPTDLEGQVYIYQGLDAVRHIFSVAASLDSLVIGEPQVLSQVKSSHRASQDAGMSGPELESLLQAAYATDKRVRRETAISERPVSIAAAATQLICDLHGDLTSCRCLLVGAGEMGELVVRDLIDAGLKHLTATHPCKAGPQAAACGLERRRGDFGQLEELLSEADIVLASLGKQSYTLSPEMMAEALKARRQKPIFLVDTGIPGDIDPAVDKIDMAFLYDLNDLERIAMEGRASREAESRNARRILEEEAAQYIRGRTERAAAPALVRLRTHFEVVRREALQDAGGDGEKATRLLIHRLLQDPSKALCKSAASGGNGEFSTMETFLGRLFRLDERKRESNT